MTALRSAGGHQHEPEEIRRRGENFTGHWCNRWSGLLWKHFMSLFGAGTAR